MSKKKLKQVELEQGKRFNAPTHVEVQSGNKVKPAFSLEYLTPSHCVSLCSDKEKAALIDRLREMSRLTWDQLTLAPRHGQGFEKIRRNALKVSVPNFITDDVQVFLVFRFSGKAPMIGYRAQHIFYIIWVDPKFSVYNH